MILMNIYSTLEVGIATLNPFPNPNTNKPSKEISSSVTTQTKKKMTTPLYKPSDTEKSSKTDLTIMYIIAASIGGILIVIALVAVCIYWKKSGYVTCQS